MTYQRMTVRITSILFGSMMLVGFRVFPTIDVWRISIAEPKLWIQFCERPEMSSNDLPKNDPMYGQPVSFDALTDRILDDYNNVKTSYVRLFDADTDVTFDSSDTSFRVINVCFQGVDGPMGRTMRKAINGQITQCEIVLNQKVIGSALNYLHVFTHEIGHCLGLDHPQDTTFSIMSYFNSDVSLQIDDKMGLTYLFPIDPSYAQETPSFGVSCEH